VSRRDEGSEFDSGVMVDGTGGGNFDLGSDGNLITPATDALQIVNVAQDCRHTFFPHIIVVSLAFKTNITVKMAQQQQMPTFKLVLVGDGGTGKVMHSQKL
jgi:hypothetical protein